MVFDNLSEKGWAHFAAPLDRKTADNRGKTRETRDAHMLELTPFSGTDRASRLLNYGRKGPQKCHLFNHVVKYSFRSQVISEPGVIAEVLIPSLQKNSNSKIWTHDFSVSSFCRRAKWCHEANGFRFVARFGVTDRSIEGGERGGQAGVAVGIAHSAPFPPCVEFRHEWRCQPGPAARDRASPHCLTLSSGHGYAAL